MIRWTLEIRLMDLGNMEIYFSVRTQSFFAYVSERNISHGFLGSHFESLVPMWLQLQCVNYELFFCAWFLEMCKFLHGPAFWGSQKDIFSFKRYIVPAGPTLNIGCIGKLIHLTYVEGNKCNRIKWKMTQPSMEFGQLWFIMTKRWRSKKAGPGCPSCQNHLPVQWCCK